MDNTNDHFFQVSVKGLFFDENNKLFMIQEDNGKWEVPGGRIQKGESFIECLKREVLEETGLECEILEQHPSVLYPTIDLEGRGRVMIFFKINLKSLEFTPSDECVAINFFGKDEMRKLDSYPQLAPLPDYL